MIATDEMLLERLRDVEAHEAWRVFYDLYWAAILRYASKLGLNDAQARDVLQDTMVTLMHVLPGFRYDRTRGRFRNFLLTIVHRKALATMRRTSRTRSREAEIALGAAVDGDGLPAEATERWRESVVAAVLDELRADPEIDARCLGIFEAYVVQRRAGGEVAAEFGVKENTVHQTKSRILRRLRAAVRLRLDDSGDNWDG